MAALSETTLRTLLEFAILTVKALAAAARQACGFLPMWYKLTLTMGGWWTGCRQTHPSHRQSSLAAFAVLSLLAASGDRSRVLGQLAQPRSWLPAGRQPSAATYSGREVRGR